MRFKTPFIFYSPSISLTYYELVTTRMQIYTYNETVIDSKDNEVEKSSIS